MNTQAPTILVEPEHLVIFPSQGRHHRVIVPRRSIEHIEISEPHGSVVAHDPWWQWGHRLMILTGTNEGGNWSEPST